ncbi:hypothetical protein [Devosia sp. 1635]|uniref:hypothetical protein n=1 Tax=Devosia sp. 1635 TaxID=2726066 RepID=UPI00156536F5|nr:hypothetical protein [Devosia sp. 1635]
MDALRDAIALCRELSLQITTTEPTTKGEDDQLGPNTIIGVPLWVIEASHQLAVQRIAAGAVTEKKGPHSSEANETFSRKKHLVRHLLVRERLEKGYNVPDACYAVSEALSKSPFFAGEDAVKKSYYVVLKALDSKSEALRYYAGWRSLARSAVNATKGLHHVHSAGD